MTMLLTVDLGLTEPTFNGGEDSRVRGCGDASDLKAHSRSPVHLVGS